MGTQLDNTWGGTKGAAFVELAIVLPLLVLLALGVFDFARAIHAKNMITNMSREGANLASRSAIPGTNIMNAIAYTAQPLDMINNGTIYLTVVQGQGNEETGSVVPMIQSQISWRNKSNPQSKIGSAGNVAQSLASLNLAEGETVYSVEIFYRYRGMFFHYLGLDKQLYSMSVF